MAFRAHTLSPSEHKAMLDMERRGKPFLAYRDGLGDLRFIDLEKRERLAIGRVAGNDLVLDWDPQVSRSHAELERLGVDWTLSDDGVSRNGSHVNDERILGRRRLSDGDVMRVGKTTLVFRAPATGFDSTLAENPSPPAHLTDAERRVLVALVAPVAAERGPARAPATNAEIAAALNLSLDGVKSHVRSLFAKLDVGDLPQYQKRTELARLALDRGLVSRADLMGGDHQR